MKKALAAVCYIAEIALMSAAGWFSYKAFDYEISYEAGILIFIPLMIASYWFSTFFHQLTTIKDADGNVHYSINKHIAKLLALLSQLITIALVGLWVYIFLFRTDFNRTLQDLKRS